VTAPGFTEPLLRLLTALPERIPPGRIDRLWRFAPRDLNGRESGLLVLSLFDPAGPAAPTRELVTLQYEAEAARDGIRLTDLLTSQGRAPADRIPRLIEGVLARLDDEREDPVAEEIGGDPERWTLLLARAAGEDG
jgi:hypothetical protein